MRDLLDTVPSLVPSSTDQGTSAMHLDPPVGSPGENPLTLATHVNPERGSGLTIRPPTAPRRAHGPRGQDRSGDQARKPLLGDDSDSPSDSEPLDVEGRFYCPFPGCACAPPSGFPGWATRVSLVTHVANYHVAAGDMPSRSWLRQANQWVCSQCQTLHSAKRRPPRPECVAQVTGDLPQPWHPGQPREQGSWKRPSFLVAQHGVRTTLDHPWGG